MTLIESVVLLEERALALELSEPGALSTGEYEAIRREVKTLRAGVSAPELLRRLDAVLISTICARQQWDELGVAA